MDPALQNDIWMRKVWALISEGFGTEDIAVKLKCDIESVRREVAILRESGHLKYVLGVPL